MTDENDRTRRDQAALTADEHDREERDEQRDEQADTPNPPRTTTGKLTAPKFGSAGSGGLELEPGPERD